VEILGGGSEGGGGGIRFVWEEKISVKIKKINTKKNQSDFDG
jgi:hypothetical protein